MYIRAISRAALLCSTILSFNAFAAADRVDYDLDDDGLIEINDLADLNDIRNHLDGAALYGDSTGCPEEGCNGFELTTDLDFDTNGDGQMNELDSYWNAGQGWEPIGSSYEDFFSGSFNGNGHQIRNLYIDRAGHAGLFGYIKGTSSEPVTLSRIVISGPMTSVIGKSDSGLFAGVVKYAVIDRVFVSGSIKTQSDSGGLSGDVSNSAVSNVFSSASIIAGNTQGGLIARLNDSSLANSLSTGYVESDSGLSSYSYRNDIKSIYWSADTSGRATGPDTNPSYFGAPLSELQCPISSNNHPCSDSGILYESWDSGVWDFGAGHQLPGLIIGNRVYRDSDGDGALDEDDAFPYNFSASIDLDSDGAADRWTIGCDASCIEQSGLTYDAFPASVSASQDADLDGLVDEWADGCDISCQTNSNLAFDDFPGDRDNDGIADAVDTDDNNDGTIDADADSDGMIDVASLEELNAIRFALEGSGQAMFEGNLPDTSGCPVILWQGIAKQRCHGYELVADLDFDTNGDGQMNEQDAYWNDGEGWEPIDTPRFSTFSFNLDGNGHQIRNLNIVSDSHNIGLFGYVRKAELSNLVLTGPLTKITGRSGIGILAGSITDSSVYNVYTSGAILATETQTSNAGGLAGFVRGTSLHNIQSAAVLEGVERVGGIVGYATSGSRITQAIASGAIIAPLSNVTGGIAGRLWEPNVSNSYWATDTTSQHGSPSSSVTDNYLGATLSELQCPSSNNDTTCVNGASLYNGWSTNSWNFGTDQQLPGLIMGGRIYRDSDGDGVLDEEDAFPDSFAASIDIDGDRAPDRWTTGCDAICTEQSELTFDAFPSSAAAHLDGDLDGLVDEWADDCDVNCQANSGLTFDDYPGDKDNDGIADTVDTDDNNDGTIDADADSDGLIDVASLEELNAIRFALDGSEQVMIKNSLPDTSGCPTTTWEGTEQQRCHGYELVAGLDFDTNGDGQMNELDTYWNDGEGWEPIGPSYYYAFTAEFEGNGHQIRNLYINSFSYDVGLFGFIKNAELSDFALTGPLTSITGRSDVGILSGSIHDSTVSKIYVSGSVLASNTFSKTGGVAGSIAGTALENVQSAAAIHGTNYTGGVVGFVGPASRISRALATGAVIAPTSDVKGGLAGGGNEYEILNSYWATDTSDQETSPKTNTSYFGALLSELQCPTSANNSTCTGNGRLYENWDSDVWDFGSDRQLPGLTMNGVVYRDSDGDGALDEVDSFQSNFSASVDIDDDGAADRWTIGCDTACVEKWGLPYDAFPNSSAASLDADFDGLVDIWTDGCNTTCQSSSGLTFDAYPDDHDNDGIIDPIDSDDNNDGTTDADMDSDGLIDISSLEELNAIRFALDGSGQVMTKESLPDTSGCPTFILRGNVQQRCIGYELISDLDFDTNSDGQIDEQDTYWNDGEGWEPIGSYSSRAFTADFNGNGHKIRNLYIDRTMNAAGLFGYIKGTSIQPVKLTQIVINGPMTSITGSGDTGMLAGTIDYAGVDRVFVSGIISAWSDAGGLAGKIRGSTVSNVFSSVSNTAGRTQGGLIGSLSASTLFNSLSTGFVASGGGLLRHSSFNNNDSLYWATDTSSQTTSEGTNASYFGALLSELQCPTSANNSTCTGNGRLYENWDSDVWDFGSDRQLPGLIMNGVVYRDSDGDGTLDVNLNAPSVALILTQAGREEATIVEGMGDVTIEAIISDEDDWDAHFIEWSSNDINLSASYEFGNSITFSSDGLVAGDYTISATVTDNGIPQLSDTAEMTIRVISNVDSAPAASSGGGGSGGGAMLWLLALLSAPLLIGRVRA